MFQYLPKQLGMSLIYIKNKSGPRVEPCGTQQWIGSGFDLTFSTSTYCVLSLLRKCIFLEKKRLTFWTAKYSSFLLTGVRIYAFKQFKSFVYTIFPFARILKELKNDIYAFLPSPRLGSCKLVGCIPALVYWALK